MPPEFPALLSMWPCPIGSKARFEPAQVTLPTLTPIPSPQWGEGWHERMRVTG